MTQVAPYLADVPAEQRLDYRKIRSQVQDGDVLLFRGTILLSRIIEKASHGKYSHAAIALDWGTRKMILQAELMGGVQAVPMSVAIGTYEGRVDWFKIRPECRGTIDMTKLIAEAKADLGLTYDTSDLLRVAAHNLFGTTLPEDCNNPHALFCSQYVERCFRQAGARLCGATDVGTSPSAIATSDILVYKGAIAHDPALVPNRSADTVKA